MVVPSAQKASSTVSPRPAVAASIASKAEGVVDRLAQTRCGRLDRLEIGDQWPQLRVLDAELLAADGNDLPVSRISEESSQQMPSDKSRCTGEEGGALR
jgi:hypothetical protein